VRAASTWCSDREGKSGGEEGAGRGTGMFLSKIEVLF
jgi:hypothetical protein